MQYVSPQRRQWWRRFFTGWNAEEHAKQLAASSSASSSQDPRWGSSSRAASPGWAASGFGVASSTRSYAGARRRQGQSSAARPLGSPGSERRA